MQEKKFSLGVNQNFFEVVYGELRQERLAMRKDELKVKGGRSASSLPFESFLKASEACDKALMRGTKILYAWIGQQIYVSLYTYVYLIDSRLTTG